MSVFLNYDRKNCAKLRVQFLMNVFKNCVYRSAVPSGIFMRLGG